MSDDWDDAGDDGSEPLPQPSPRDRRNRAEALERVADSLLMGAPYLRDSANVIYRYNGRWWEELSPADLDAIVYEEARWLLSSAARAEVAKLLGAKVHRRELQFGRVADTEVACNNCVVDVVSGRARAHHPEDLLENVLPHDYDPGARCPVWQAALLKLFPDPEDGRHDALQEYFGYVALSHAKLKKALLLKGPGDTGKSVIIDAAKQMVGFAQCCQLGMQQMDDPRHRAIIKGKRLNVITELSARALVADSGFKALTGGEEPIGIDRKFHDAETIIPTAKHVISTNELPRLANRTEEVFARLLIVPMTRVLTEGEQDKGLRAKLAGEMRGMLAWAIEGARRLIAQGGVFTAPAGADGVLAEWGAEQNPMRDFLDEHMAEEIGEVVPLERIARMLTERHRKSVSARQVGKWARAIGLQVKKMRPKDAGRGSVRCIIDWTLSVKPPSELSAYDFHDEPP